MAKKKTETKTSIVEDVPDGTIPGVDNGQFNFDLTEDEIRTIKVHKIVPGHRPIFQFETLNTVTETQLQKYGGGLYTISYYGEDAKKPKHVEEIEVGEPPIDQVKPLDASTIQIQMLKEQSQMNRDLLMAVLGRTNPTTSTPTPMSEIATIWSLIHGTTPNPNGGNGGSFDKLIEIFKLGMELGGKVGGEMDWKQTLIATAKELAPGILQVVNKGVPVVETNFQVPLQISQEQLLKHGLSLLKPRILSGLPVGLALDWIVANANDPQYQGFLALALRKEFQDLVNADNDVANEPYNTWLRQFLTGLKEHFKEAISEEVNEVDFTDSEPA